jgi:hypothetical protein
VTDPVRDPDSVFVFEVTAIRAHPHADTLTLVSLGDHDRELVANLKDDGSFRYAPGDLLILYPVGAILPQDLLEEMGAWDAGKGKGTLASNRGNRVGPRKFMALDGNPDPAERYESRGALRPLEKVDGQYMLRRDGETLTVIPGQDVREFLGIEMYVPK